MLALRRRFLQMFFFLQMWWGLENDCDYELAQDGMHRWSDLDFYFVFAKTWKDWMMGFAPMMLVVLWTLHKSLRCQWQSGGRKVLRGNHPLSRSRAFEALLTKMQSCFFLFLKTKYCSAGKWRSNGNEFNIIDPTTTIIVITIISGDSSRGRTQGEPIFETCCWSHRRLPSSSTGSSWRMISTIISVIRLSSGSPWNMKYMIWWYGSTGWC